MEHNNKHLIPGFHPATFPTAFAGLQNAGTNAFMSTLQQLSGLSTPILPAAADLAQWAATAAAAQPTGQTWIDPAKVAAMLPMYQVFTGVKGLELAQSELLAQQTITAVSTASSAATTSSSIFPSPIVNVSSNKSSCNSPNDNAPTQTSPTNGHMSSAPSSHPSTSTTQEIDVGSISQPASQTQAYDLSIRGSPPLNTSPSAAAEQSPITNTRPVSSQPATPKSNAMTKTNSQLPAQVGIQAPMEDNWAGIDLGDLDLFVGSTTKENEAAMSSVLDLGVANLFPDNMGAFTETPNKTNNFSIAALAQPNTSHPEIAVADQEFDRIFSSFVTEPTESTSATTSTFPFDFHSGDNNPSLSPVQFTPPDSPTANTPEPDVMGIFGGPSTSGVQTASVSTTFIPSANPAVMPSIAKRKIDTFKPTVSIATSQSSSFKKEPLLTRPVQKCNKIPVYKQKKATMIVPDEENSKIKTESNDAYSFDDDDDGGLGPMDPREKLDAEVREKLSRVTNQHPEMRNKNIYVPGVGFAVPPEHQQDLWRHVVPKKRPTGENRPIIPAANLLPSSVHAEASQAAARLADPEIVTLAESIRRRKKDRLACSFIKTEQTTNNECAKEEGADKRAEEMRRESEDHPRLPKLVIKLPRRSLDKVYEKRKKKKRKKKDDDSDWEVNDRSKRKKHKRIRQEKTNSSGYELRVIEREPEEEYKPPPIEEDKPDISMFSKKRRLIMQWQEGQENKARENGEHKTNGTSSFTRHNTSRNEFNTEAIKARLSKFGPADNLPKGTFVVSKTDLFRDDCALWRVDNQGMIQKYPPRIDPATKNVSYKNSSTYSGWGEHLAAAYYRVAIRHVKQTRSEAEVEPEIPLSDLFPAMTSECNDSNGFVKGDDETPVDPEDHMTMLRDPLRLSLYTFTLAMVNHALTLEFFQSMKQKNDWNFLRAVTEIEKVNSDCIAKVKGRVKFTDKYEETIDRYTQMFITESDYHEVQCQCCSMRPVDRLIQLYSMDSYDSESLQPIEKESCEKSPLPATELLVCSTCANATQFYHRCRHMKYHLLKKCEDKLELIGTQHPEYSPERTVDMAKKSRSWINKVLTEYMDMWKKIQNTDI